MHLAKLSNARLSDDESSFELYERNGGREKSDKEYSIKLSLSEGAHSSNVLDSAVDARHSLNVQARRYDEWVDLACFERLLTVVDCGYRKLTQHLPYSLVIEKLSKHFDRTFEVMTLANLKIHADNGLGR